MPVAGGQSTNGPKQAAPTGLFVPRFLNPLCKRLSISRPPAGPTSVRIGEMRGIGFHSVTSLAKFQSSMQGLYMTGFLFQKLRYRRATWDDGFKNLCFYADDLILRGLKDVRKRKNVYNFQWHCRLKGGCTSCAA